MNYVVCIISRIIYLYNSAKDGDNKKKRVISDEGGNTLKREDKAEGNR